MWTNQANSGPPENGGFGSLASEPWCSLLTAGNVNGLSSEPARGSDIEGSVLWVEKKQANSTKLKKQR